MRIVLVHEVSLKDGSSSETLFKAIDSNIRSNQGDIIEDPAFFSYSYNPIVITVRINYGQDKCYISLSELVLETNDLDDLTEYVINAQINGWFIEKPI